MNIAHYRIILSLCFSILLVHTVEAQTFDTLVFGNASSESNHALKTYFPPASNTSLVYWQNTPQPSDPSGTPPSDVVSGGMGLSARRLLPRMPNHDVYGGQMSFTMAVDPVKQNYFSVKMWGSDPNSGNGYLILDVNGKEIGGRHGTGGIDEDPLYYYGSGWLPDCFFYRTEPIPLSMTTGKTAVMITIRSLGSIFDYAPNFTYVPQYQSVMSGPSMGLYTAYTHAGSIPSVTGEVQGTAPTVPTPNTLSPAASATIATTESNVNSTFANDLNAVGSSLSQSQACFLAECYDAKTNGGANWIAYPNGTTSASAGNQIVAALDALVTSYASNTSVATNGWGGALGSGGMGDAVRLAWPLISSSMSTQVAYGGTLGTISRQAGWSAALRASIDAGRYNRQTIANQAMDNAWNIYCANRGLLLVDSTNALNESEAQRYMLEAAGVNPWLGNDQATGGTDGTGGGPVPTYGIPPYGPNWYMCTTKGTTKDGNGFVGSDYGEQGSFVYEMGLVSGNAQLLSRGITMTLARCKFRYPGTDSNGFLIMQGTDVIGVRNNNLPGHYVYMGRSSDNDFLMAAQGTSAIGNDCMGYFQEGINDGQMVSNFDTSNPYLPSEWAAITAQAQTGVKLPAAPNQPDYAWADEQNMVVAAMHNGERFYANLFWRQPSFINGLAKVFHLTGNTAHIADVMVDDVQYRPTGQTITTAAAVDWFDSPAAPDNPLMAYGGLQMPVAWRSDLTSIPADNRDGGRGTGYTFHYGNWLVGMNSSYTANYTVQLPSNFTSATDMISGQMMSGPVVLAPQTTVVFYLANPVDPNPPPSRTLSVSAMGGNGYVEVDWYAAGAATSYNVLRSTTSGGPYTTIAAGVTATHYVDTSVTSGTPYYYVVQSVNATGVASGNSPETSATPLAPETSALPSPWADVDIGTSSGGSATLSSGTFTLTSGAGDIWNSADGLHFVYQPMAGDGIITARVVGQSSTNSYAKAGLMIRDSLAASGAEASINIEPVERAEFDVRGSDGGSSSNQAYGSTLANPYWVRLIRSGATITSYVSPDGSNWTQVGSTTFGALPYVAYVGLDLSPANTGTGQKDTGMFDNVTFPLGATLAPAVPTGLTTTLGVTYGGQFTNAGVTLNWTATPGAASYNIARSTSASGPFTTIVTGVALNSYADFGVANGTYYYEVSAVNSIGASAASPAVSVQLGASPSAVNGLTATTTSGQVALSWTAASGASSYTITRAVNGGSFSILASAVTGTSYTDTTVANGTLYYYGIEPVNAYGPGLGAQTTALPPGSLPSPWQSQDIGQPLPGGASYSTGTFTLMGAGSDIWNTSDQFQYVYQTLTGDCEITAQVTSMLNTSAWDKAGVMIRNTLDPNSAYYAVEVTSGNGISAQYRSSAGASAATNATTSGLAAPYWVKIIRIGSIFSSFVSANGSSWVYLGSQTISMNATVTIGLLDCSQNSGTLNTATISNVSVLDSFGNGGTASASANGPSGQKAAQAFDGNMSDMWDTNVTGGTAWLQYQFASGVSHVVTEYELVSASTSQGADPSAWQFQGSNNGSTWTRLDTETGQLFATRTGINDFTISNNTAYQYYRLYITSNEGGANNDIQIAEMTLLGPASGNPTIVPDALTDLSAVWGNGQITISWSANAGATSYDVLRSTSSGGPYTTIATGVTGLSYADTTVTNGTPYYYVVTAVDAAGQSGDSPQDSATALAPPSTPTGLSATFASGQATLSWTAVTGAASYNIERATVNGGPYTIVGTTTGTSYSDTGLANGTTYYYVVTAVNLAAQSSATSQVSILTSPGAPAGLIAQANSDQVTLSWTPPTGAASYSVYFSTTSGGPYTPVASGITTASFTHTGLTNGTTYYYVVTAANSGGSGPDSAQVSGIPAAQSLYWDTTTAAGLGNGNGSWDINTTPIWSNSSSGTSNPLLTFLNDDNVYFQTAGTMTATLASGATTTVSSINQSVNNTAVTISSGTLQIDTNSGITNGVGGGNKSLTINSAIVLNSPNVTVDNETTLAGISLGGVISGNCAITKIGAGNLTLGQANTFSGGLTIIAGQVSNGVNSNLTLFGTGTITLASTSGIGVRTLYVSNTGFTFNNNFVIQSGTQNRIEFSANYTLPFNGRITGGGLLQISSGFNPVFQFNGDVTQFTGTLQCVGNGETGSATTNYDFTNTSALGAPDASILLNSAADSTNAANVVLLRWNPTSTTSATIPIGSLSSSYGSSQTSANVVLENAKTSTTATFQIGALGLSALFTGTIQNGVGTVAITKVGSGTLTLSGSNSYTGVTTVNGGILLVNSSLSSSSAVTVNTAATLGGSGTINGATTLDSGGILAPGQGTVSTLTFAGGLNLEAGSILNLNLGSASDSVALTASYTPPSGGTAIINITAISGFGAGTYNLITGAGGISTTTFALGVTPTGYTYVLNASGGTLSLTVAPTPPTGLTATEGNGLVTLAWSPSSNATSYNIQRAPVSGGPYTSVGITSGTNFSDSSVSNGTPYYYVVNAIANGVASVNSSQVSATPLSPFQQWLIANGLAVTTSQDSMPDSDGLPLLLKYATGLTPGTPSVAGPASISSNGDFLTLRFNRLSPAPVNYLVESSPDLVNWSSLATLAAGTSSWTGAATVAESGTNPVAVSLTDSVAMPTGTSTRTATPRFLRLRVTTTSDTTEPGTIPQGDVPVSLTGTTTSATSIPLDNAPVARNTVQAVATSALTVVNASTWSSGTTPFALRLLSGNGSGSTFAVGSVSGNTLNLATQGVDLTQLVAAGDLYEILPLDTLGSLYGTTSTPFLSGSSASAADNLLFWNGTNWMTYFYNGTNWLRSGSFLSQNNTALPLGGGMITQLRGSNSVNYDIIGRVPEVALQQFTTPGGYTFLSGAYPAATTVGATGFAAASNWLNGSSSGGADNVMVWNGTTWLSFFFNGTNWLRAGSFLNQNSFALPVGEPLMIYRRSTPAVNNAFVTQPLPYSP